MKWVLWSLAPLAAIAGIVTIIGWVLPTAHEASRSAHVDRNPKQVYDVVADLAGYRTWLEDTTRVEVVEAVSPSRLVTRVADPEQPFGGTWTFAITPEGSGSRVTITERGEVYNPIFRFMARFVFGYTATMEEYLRSLQRRLGR